MALQAAACWLIGGQPLDPRVLPVLREVSRTGSLNQAVVTLRMSYRNAWGLLGRTERALKRPLLVLRRGQGARLTAFGESLLTADGAAAEILARGLADELKALNQESAPGASQTRSRPLVVHASHDFALACCPPVRPPRGWNCIFSGASTASLIWVTDSVTSPAFTFPPIRPARIAGYQNEEFTHAASPQPWRAAWPMRDSA